MTPSPTLREPIGSGDHIAPPTALPAIFTAPEVMLSPFNVPGYPTAPRTTTAAEFEADARFAATLRASSRPRTSVLAATPGFTSGSTSGHRPFDRTSTSTTSDLHSGILTLTPHPSATPLNSHRPATPLANTPFAAWVVAARRLTPAPSVQASRASAAPLRRASTASTALPMMPPLTMARQPRQTQPSAHAEPSRRASAAVTAAPGGDLVTPNSPGACFCDDTASRFRGSAAG